MAGHSASGGGSTHWGSNLNPAAKAFPFVVGCGSEDPIPPFAKAKEFAATLEKEGFDVRTVWSMNVGHTVTPEYDKKTVDEINKNLAASNYQFQSLINEIVKSLPFQSRRGEAVTTENSVKPKEVAQR